MYNNKRDGNSLVHFIERVQWLFIIQVSQTHFRLNRTTLDRTQQTDSLSAVTALGGGPGR